MPDVTGEDQGSFSQLEAIGNDGPPSRPHRTAETKTANAKGG